MDEEDAPADTASIGGGLEDHDIDPVPPGGSGKGTLQVVLMRDVPPVNPKSVPVRTLDMGLDQCIYIVTESHDRSKGNVWLRLPVGRQVEGLAELGSMLPDWVDPEADLVKPKKRRITRPFSILPGVA